MNNDNNGKSIVYRMQIEHRANYLFVGNVLGTPISLTGRTYDDVATKLQTELRGYLENLKDSGLSPPVPIREPVDIVPVITFRDIVV